MDPINPWLDPSEVRHLAEQLIRPVTQSGMTSKDPGFDKSFVGFTDQEEPPARTTGAPTQEASDQPFKKAPTEAETPMEDPPEEVVPAEIATNSKQFESPERIQILRNWLVDYFQASEIFILDAEGDVIFDESGHGRLHVIASSLVLAPGNKNHIHIKIGPVSILELIPSETTYGRVILGFLVKKNLRPEQLENITEVLKQTVSPG